MMKKHANFWKITEDSLDFAMKSHNINKNFRNELLQLYKKLEPYSDLNKCLNYLKVKQIKTCILSNGSPTLLDELTINAKVKDLFNDIISIEEVGIYKPDPRVYELVTKRYSCKPEEVCFMSSNTWDVVGGGYFGYKSVWVNRFNKNFDNLDYNPNYKIKDLSDLIKML